MDYRGLVSFAGNSFPATVFNKQGKELYAH